MRHRRELVMVVVIALLSGMAPLASEQVGRLQPGSDPSVLPGPVLIADRGNDRLVLVDPEGRVLWTFPEFEDENGMIRGIVVLALHPHGAWKH